MSRTAFAAVTQSQTEANAYRLMLFSTKSTARSRRSATMGDNARLSHRKPQLIGHPITDCVLIQNPGYYSLAGFFKSAITQGGVV